MSSRTTTVESLGENLLETSRNVWLAGLGIFARMEEESRELFDSLVEKGKKFESEQKKGFDKTSKDVKKMGDKFQHTMEDTVTGALKRFGVPSRKDVQELTARVEELSKKLEKLEIK
jgi:poly(hydroxyalkanoate) granule-associated protein